MKNYIDIERCKESYAETFRIGERIVIQEKIDGANAQFFYNSETETLECCSRKRELNSENTLNGFYNWVKSLNVQDIGRILGDRYVIFGEWMGAKHSIKYPENVMGKFWMFDVWDKEIEQYIPYAETRKLFEKLRNYGVENFVPVFYEGDFNCWEDILSLVGRTDVGAEPSGEGIVIKRQEFLDSKSSRLPYYVKIVDEKFSEVHKPKKQKFISAEALAAKEAERELVATVVTPRRIDKMLYKLIEEGELRQDWDEHDMKFIAANLPKAMFADCKKEEPETVEQSDNFGKICSSITMDYVKKLLNKR